MSWWLRPGRNERRIAVGLAATATLGANPGRDPGRPGRRLWKPGRGPIWGRRCCRACAGPRPGPRWRWASPVRIAAARRPSPRCSPWTSRRPVRASQLWQVVACPECGCRFYLHQTTADYGAGEMLTRGRASLYLQQGAGLAQLFRPIARLSCPPGTRVLDIGCGFGFGLDFAVRARGWRGLGMDPAQIAGLGSRPAGASDRAASADGARAAAARGVRRGDGGRDAGSMCRRRRRFCACLKATLAPGGVLVLTTPDADAVTPATPPGQLAGLLSPELHIVLQSEGSLRGLLGRAGFAHVEIVRDGGAPGGDGKRGPSAAGRSRLVRGGLSRPISRRGRSISRGMTTCSGGLPGAASPRR